MTDQRIPAPAPQEGAGPAAAPTVMAPAQPFSPTPDASPDSGHEDWRAGLPDNLRRVAEKFTSPADVVKSYATLERRLGRSVTVPDGNAAPAEIDAFYARLGRPEGPEGYDVCIPDGLPDHLRPGPEAEAGRAAFLSAMHAAGATPAVVQAAFDWYYDALAQADADSGRAAGAARAEADAALRRDWGAAYDRNLALARRAARHFGGDDFIAKFERAALADDAVCLRAFSRIGAALAEDALLAGAAAPAVSAQQRIDRLMGEHFGKPSYASAAVQDELRALYQTLYGGGPADAD